jgi:hypothetical protein
LNPGKERHNERDLVMVMTRRLALAAIFAVAFPRPSVAQVDVSMAELQFAVTSLARAAAGLPENLRSTRLMGAIQWMQKNAANTRTESVSREYLRSLERAAKLLSHLQSATVIDDVTRELEAKVEHCRRLKVGMGGTVLLKVNTRRGASVISDWQVLYLLKFDDWLKTPPRNFLRVSSPTEMGIEPGRYWIWARDPATGKISDRVLVEVAGEKSLALDLPVP